MAEVYGLLAEFNQPETLLAAVRAAKERGYRRLQTYTPFPVEGMDEALDFRDGRVMWCGLAGGLFGAIGGFLMEVFINYDYALDVGGRAVIAVPAFFVVAFELTILCAVLFAVCGMLYFNRLPRLYHPLFKIDRFSLASRDRFFLCLTGDDGQFELKSARRFFETLKPISIREVER